MIVSTGIGESPAQCYDEALLGTDLGLQLSGLLLLHSQRHLPVRTAGMKLLSGRLRIQDSYMQVRYGDERDTDASWNAG